MNLYASSIRVCFLLFESMRVHLKFQLEVAVLIDPHSCHSAFIVLVPEDLMAMSVCSDVPEEAHRHHHFREH